MTKTVNLPHVKGEVQINNTFLHSEMVKEFFSRPNIEQALEDANFEYVYKEWAKTQYIRAALTEILLAAGIDVLKYLTEIPEYAFFGCESLTSITIPGNITKIGKCAFIGCEALTSIVIPDSVTEMGEWVFTDRCDNLETIYCEAKEQPAGWSIRWNGADSAKVIWGA